MANELRLTLGGESVAVGLGSVTNAQAMLVFRRYARVKGAAVDAMNAGEVVRYALRSMLLDVREVSIKRQRQELAWARMEADDLLLEAENDLVGD